MRRLLLAASIVTLAASITPALRAALTTPDAPADSCPAATFEISALPYGPIADTTVGASDDYDLPGGDPPNCSAPAACTGGGSIYGGSGTGPDRAWRLRTDADCDLTITMDPVSADLGLIIYLGTCSNSWTDCVCVDDSGGGGAAETLTLSAVAGVDYYVVVDGYVGSSGDYTLTVTGTGCSLVPVELQSFTIE